MDYIEYLVKESQKRIITGYYKVERKKYEKRSLKEAIKKTKNNPIIAEIKFASPSGGRISFHKDIGKIISEYVNGGAVGLSILTEPKNFDGNISYLSIARKLCSLPLLMKDIIISKVQIDAANYSGADVILLMSSVFKKRLEITSLIDYTHKLGLEVLLEVHTKEEFLTAQNSDADLVGINNRNMSSFKVSLDTSRELLKLKRGDKPVVCESGIENEEQIRELRKLGADAFLIGTALMSSNSREQLLQRFVSA